MYLLNNNKGFTIVELLIAVTILLIVISLGYSLYFFSTRSFDSGTAQAHAQQSARIVEEYFRTELRNVGYLEVSELGNGKYFSLNNSIFSANGLTLTDEVVTDIRLRIIEDNASIEIERYFLEYEVSSLYNNQNYSFTNRILLNNIYSQVQFKGISEVYRSLDGYYLNYSDDILGEPDMKAVLSTITGNDGDIVELTLLLILINDNFIDPLVKSNIRLDADFSSLNVDSDSSIELLDGGKKATVDLKGIYSLGTGRIVVDKSALQVSNSDLYADVNMILTPLTIADNNIIPDGIAGDSYEYTFTIVGGTGPYTFTIINGSLPSSLVLESDGIIRTLNDLDEIGNYDFSLRVEDTSIPKQIDEKDFTLTIKQNTSD